MAHRFTLDRQSFEEFLAAASLLQQFQKQATRVGGSHNFAQPLLELVETQKAIDSGAMDVDSAIERIVRLTLRVVGGEGSAVWLFANDEFVYRAGSGRQASRDERLRLTVLARVAAICEPSRESFPGQRNWAKGAGDSGYYPGAARSLIVGPIFQNQTVIGALAAFSTQFDAFDQRDAGNIRLLSGLIGNAIERSLTAQTRVVALPRKQVLRLIEQIVPTLQQMVEKQDLARRSEFTSAAPLTEATLTEDRELDAAAREALQPKDVEAVTGSVGPVQEAVPVPELDASVAGQTADNQSEERSDEVLNPTVLTDELARLSRSIAEIEDVGQIAESTAQLIALSETVTRNEANVADAAPAEQAVIEQAVPEESKDSIFVDASPAAEPETEQAFVFDDTAVPGIGVRAALYDDEEREPSRFWPSIRETAANVCHSLTGAIAGMFGRAGSAIAAGSRGFGHRVQRASHYRPQLPALPTDKLTARYRQVQSSISATGARTRASLRNLARRKPEFPKPQFPTFSTEALREYANRVGGEVRKTAADVGNRIRSLVNSLPDLPGFPTEPTKRQLRETQTSAAQALQKAGRGVDKLQSYRLTVRLNGRTLRRSSSAFAVLVVMSLFLIMESGIFRSDTTASAGARTEPQTKSSESLQVPAVQQSASAASQRAHTGKQLSSTMPATPRVSGPGSHREISDPATQETVENMTRYEVSTLRRQALGGDEEAAFQLGMAYEIGYDLPQNCGKAAEWVSNAAEAGYPAAEYNLGLRYRDGDGVGQNAAEARKWFSRAASHKYRPARAALAALAAPTN
jgi:hypothetical protein